MVLDLFSRSLQLLDQVLSLVGWKVPDPHLFIPETLFGDGHPQQLGETEHGPDVSAAIL